MPIAAWQFAGSLVGVALMVGLAWRLGFTGQPRLGGKQDAVNLAAEVQGGFNPVAVGLDAAGHGALLHDGRGRVVLVFAHEAHFNVQLLQAGVRTVLNGAILAIELPRRSVPLDLGREAADWASIIRRIG